MKLNWIFLTLFYSGHAPKAPGTVGTLVSLPFGIALLMFFGSQTLFMLSVLITLIAIKVLISTKHPMRLMMIHVLSLMNLSGCGLLLLLLQV